MSEQHPPRLPTSQAPPPADGRGPGPSMDTLPLAAGRPETHQNHAQERKNGTLAGLVTTGALHLALILVVIISSFSFGKKESKAQPKERIIQTTIVPIQAGSAEGMRTKGAAYKRPDKARKRRTRRRSKLYRRGPSRRQMPKGGMLAKRNSQVPQDTKDDAENAPEGWGSKTGVMAPPGAKPGDDRHGAGGSAEKGALDPCFTQHAAVVASYKQIIRKKIPRFKRPAFVSAHVARNLTTVVRVHIGGGGNISSASTARSSGNPRYDGAAVAHVKAIGKFPAPHKCVMYNKRTTSFRTSISVAVVIRSR
jgi:TonB family protein